MFRQLAQLIPIWNALMTYIFPFRFQLVCSAIALTEAQNYPPRLSIPGAVASPGQVPHRQPVLRVRRPGASLRQQNTILPAVTQRIAIEEPRPVTESAEDEQPEPYLPNLLRNSSWLRPNNHSSSRQQPPSWPANNPLNNPRRCSSSFSPMTHSRLPSCLLLPRASR